MTFPDDSSSAVPIRSRFVTTLSVLSIFISLYQIYETIRSMTAFDTLTRMNGLGLTNGMLESLMPSPAGAYLEIALAVALIGASVMMLKRMEMGRRAYIVTLAAGSLWTTVSTIQSYQSLSQYLSMPSVQENALLLMFLSVAVTIGIAWYVIRKLTREELRKEFRYRSFL